MEWKLMGRIGVAVAVEVGVVMGMGMGMTKKPQVFKSPFPRGI
jgi:hypothetical protein